jgi:hypothetical protein
MKGSSMNNATDEDYLREEAVNDLKASQVVRYEPATGCWIDDRWGHYGVARLVDIAQDYGFEISDLDESALWAYRNNERFFQDEVTGEHHESSDWMLMQGGLADEAEDWLNDNIAKPGYVFGWNDGEFFLMHHTWWSEEEL